MGQMSYKFQVLHSRLGSWPYPQTLDWAGKANTMTYYDEERRFYNIDTWTEVRLRGDDRCSRLSGELR